VSAYGVLDGELVQPELARDVGELLVRRAVEPDPGDPATIATRRGHLREILRFEDPLAVAVDGTTDDHTASLFLALVGALSLIGERRICASAVWFMRGSRRWSRRRGTPAGSA
jgi:hypothetical protein